MAAFDRSYGHIVVRVVYDGPAAAGKTENLRQLVQSFSSQRRGELSSPGPTGEGTTYFDWLYLNGGVVDGHPLRAQLVTVPGRSVLTRRRWQLVKSADVIVFVCESTPRGLKEAKRWLELLRAHLAAAAQKPTIVVQANKQDLPEAAPPEEVARALGLAHDAEVVAASASTGAGVRETVVRAIRAAAAVAERELLARGVDGMPDAEEETQLLAQLDGSAQMRAALDVSTDALPPFPPEDVPSGAVWPGTTGRAVLRTLARALATEGVRRVRADDACTVLRVGSLCAKTSRERRIEDPAAARAALLDLARARVRLGDLHAPDTTLVLATGPDGATWLWTVAPWVTTLRERLDATGDEAAVASAARAYADAIAQALVLAVRDGVGLDVDPSHFGQVGDRIVYLSDAISTTSSAAAILDRIQDVSRRWAPSAAKEYVAALGRALAGQRPLLQGLGVSVAQALERAGHSPGRQDAWRELLA